MAKYRNDLPQLSGKLFLTDGGIETTLIFHEGLTLPFAISFTIEMDGRLPNGQTLQESIAQVDAATGNTPMYSMINCAHPTHFAGALVAGAPWMARIRGLRAHASTRSHAELDEAVELDTGNPRELGGHYRALRSRLSHLNVLGGCCGTGHRHVEEICQAVLSQ
jgi:S-methylmethionine-dependent homocysteine/selenocysteine methylase